MFWAMEILKLPTQTNTKHNELQFTWNTKFQFWQKLMIYGLIRPYLSIKSRKNVLKIFFLMVENQKSDSKFFGLLNKSSENVL